MQHHFNINVIGTMILFRAVLPMLRVGRGLKFVVMSTSAASIGDIEKLPFS